MRFSIVALFAAVGLSAAWTQPKGDTPLGNPTIAPALNELVTAGKPYTIKWTNTTEGTVTILLLRGPSTNVVPLFAIVEKTQNEGTFVWDVPTTLEADTTHYGMQIIVDSTGQYQYTPQFGVSNPHPVSASSVASTAAPTAGHTSSCSTTLSTATSPAPTSTCITTTSTSATAAAVPASSSSKPVEQPSSYPVHVPSQSPSAAVTTLSVPANVSSSAAALPASSTSSSASVPVYTVSAAPSVYPNSTLPTGGPTGYLPTSTSTSSPITQQTGSGAGPKLTGLELGGAVAAIMALWTML